MNIRMRVQRPPRSSACDPRRPLDDPRLATTLAVAHVPAGPGRVRAFPPRSEHGRGRLHEGNLDADQRNYGRADSLVVEWHDAARSRDQPPPEESRPEPERQIVEVASSSADAEERRDSLRRIRLKAAHSAARAPEHVPGTRR